MRGDVGEKGSKIRPENEHENDDLKAITRKEPPPASYAQRLQGSFVGLTHVSVARSALLLPCWSGAQNVTVECTGRNQSECVLDQSGFPERVGGPRVPQSPTFDKLFANQYMFIIIPSQNVAFLLHSAVWRLPKYPLPYSRLNIRSRRWMLRAPEPSLSQSSCDITQLRISNESVCPGDNSRLHDFGVCCTTSECF